MEANNLTRAPEGATHRYEHGGLISWYRETDDNLFVWRDGSWHGAVHKTTLGLVKSCMLGRLTLLAMEQADPVDVTAPAWFTQLPAADEQADPVEDPITWLVRETKGEWFGNSTHIAKDGAGDYLWATAPRLPAEYHWFNKAQYLAVRYALQNKPSWADAPEWALSVTQRSNGEWFWLGSTDQFIGPSASSGCCGEVLGDWRDTLEQRPVDAAQFEQPVVVTVKGGLSDSDLRSIQSGTVEPLPEPDHAFLDRAADYHRLRDACRIMRERPDDCSTEAVDALYKISLELLTKRDAAVCGGQKYLDATWHERGALPPVGSNVTIVEIDGLGMSDLGREFIGKECKVMATFVRPTVLHDDEAKIVTVMEPAGGCCCFRLEMVKPIRTEHEQLTSIIDGGKRVLAAPEAIADAILAAGFKRGEV